MYCVKTSKDIKQKKNTFSDFDVICFIYIYIHTPTCVCAHAYMQHLLIIFNSNSPVHFTN